MDTQSCTPDGGPRGPAGGVNAKTAFVSLEPDIADTEGSAPVSPPAPPRPAAGAPHGAQGQCPCLFAVLTRSQLRTFRPHLLPSVVERESPPLLGGTHGLGGPCTLLPQTCWAETGPWVEPLR